MCRRVLYVWYVKGTVCASDVPQLFLLAVMSKEQECIHAWFDTVWHVWRCKLFFFRSHDVIAPVIYVCSVLKDHASSGAWHLITLPRPCLWLTRWEWVWQVPVSQHRVMISVTQPKMSSMFCLNMSKSCQNSASRYIIHLKLESLYVPRLKYYWITNTCKEWREGEMTS